MRVGAPAFPDGPTDLRTYEPDACRRVEPWRPDTVADGPSHRHVCQLLACRGAPQHQTSAAHIAASDKLLREQQPVLENRLQDVDVLRGGDAAEQHDRAIGTDVAGKRLRASLERPAVSRIVRGHVNIREPAQSGKRHQGIG